MKEHIYLHIMLKYISKNHIIQKLRYMISVDKRTGISVPAEV